MMTDIAYTRRGAGEPLVLIHGIGARRQAWTAVVEGLSMMFDVIALDLPGFGESPPLTEGPYDMAATTSFLQGFFADIGVHRPHVAGNSLGGAVALELGGRGLVASVTAISPAGFWTARQRRYAIAVLQVHRRLAGMPVAALQRISRNPSLRAQAARLIYAHPDRVDPDVFLADSISIHTCLGWDSALASGRSYECLAVPTVPTTLAWGTRDRILPIGQSVLARERLPNAAFVPLVGSGHVPMYDDPQGVIAAIVDTARR